MAHSLSFQRGNNASAFINISSEASHPRTTSIYKEPSIASEGTLGAGVFGSLGDKLIHLAGPKAALQRAETLFYQQGHAQRALKILNRLLQSNKLSEQETIRTFTNVGIIQSSLKQDKQAVRAFAGLLLYHPDCQKPDNLTHRARLNFSKATEVIRLGAVSGERFCAETIDDEPDVLESLFSKLPSSVFDHLPQIASKPPLLQILAIHTLGYLNLRRAQNTLRRNGIPRFPVSLDVNGQNPGGARTNLDGSVVIDQLTTLNYDLLLHALAHEAHGLSNPVQLTAAYRTTHRRFEEAARRSQRIVNKGESLDKAKPSERLVRKYLAQDLRMARKDLRQSGKKLLELLQLGNNQAEAFAGAIAPKGAKPLNLRPTPVFSGLMPFGSGIFVLEADGHPSKHAVQESKSQQPSSRLPSREEKSPSTKAPSPFLKTTLPWNVNHGINESGPGLHMASIPLVVPVFKKPKMIEHPDAVKKNP